MIVLTLVILVILLTLRILGTLVILVILGQNQSLFTVSDHVCFLFLSLLLPPSTGSPFSRTAPYVHVHDRRVSPSTSPPAGVSSLPRRLLKLSASGSGFPPRRPRRARTHSAYFPSTSGRIVGAQFARFCLFLTAAPVASGIFPPLSLSPPAVL